MMVENDGKSDVNGFNCGDLDYDKCVAEFLNSYGVFLQPGLLRDFKSYCCDFEGQRFNVAY